MTNFLLHLIILKPEISNGNFCNDRNNKRCSILYNLPHFSPKVLLDMHYTRLSSPDAAAQCTKS